MAINHVSVLFSTATKYLDNESGEQSLYMSFVTKELEENIERSPVETETMVLFDCDPLDV